MELETIDYGIIYGNQSENQPTGSKCSIVRGGWMTVGMCRREGEGGKGERDGFTFLNWRLSGLRVRSLRQWVIVHIEPNKF